VKRGFNAQDYLRQLGQRAIEDPQNVAGFPRGIRVVSASRALCAIDAIDPETAQDIINEPLDRLLSSLEYSKSLVDKLMDGQPSHGSVPEPVAVRDCTAQLPFPWGRLYLHYAVFASDHVAIEATAVGNTGQMPGFSPASITDDRGTTASARSMLGGKPGTVLGRLLTDRPLSSETRFLELGDVPVELKAQGAIPGFSGTRVGPSDPAERHLWFVASIYYAGQFLPHLGDYIEPAAEALIAAGAVLPDNKLVADLRAVGRGFEQDAIAVVDEPWKSLVRRWGEHSNKGLLGSVALGAVSDPFDGFVVRIDGLVAKSKGFDIRIETSPGTPFNLMGASDAALPPMVVWWARDDLGNHYSGRPGSGWSVAPGGSRGAIGYRPALHPEATAVELLPVSASTGTALSVRLPWAD
jgi:hypothetical protein